MSRRTAPTDRRNQWPIDLFRLDRICAPRLRACLKNSGAGLRPAMNGRLAREKQGRDAPKAGETPAPLHFPDTFSRKSGGGPAQAVVDGLPFGSVRQGFHHDPPRPFFIATVQLGVNGAGERLGLARDHADTAEIRG